MIPQFEIGATGGGTFWLCVLAWAVAQRERQKVRRRG